MYSNNNDQGEVIIVKIEDEEEEQEDSRLNRLPDEILLHIFNKLLDLKCLCWCSLVSKRFNSIVLLVHSVSFTVPRRKPNSSADHYHKNLDPNNNDNFSKKIFRLINVVVAKPFQFIRQIVGPKPVPRLLSSFYGDSFRSAVYFLSKFKDIRDLHMELPSSSHGRGDDSVFKWSAQFGSRLESFVFLYPTVICEKHQFNGHRGEEDEEEALQSTRDMMKYRVHLAFQCLKDAIVRHRMLLFLIEQHPLLRSVAITDSKKLGMLSARDGKLIELRNWINSSADTLGPKLKSIEVPLTASQLYVPVLELPVSGYVMDGAALVLMGMVERRENGGGDHDLAAIAGALGEGDDAFGEALMEMMLNHRSRMRILL